MTKLYLYLAKRDKKGMMVLAVFIGDAKTTRVSDVKMLKLDHETTSRLQTIVHENRMNYELWIEPASSYLDLHKKLTRRGYKQLPLASMPLVELHQGFVVDTSLLPSQKTMTKRKN